MAYVKRATEDIYEGTPADILPSGVTPGSIAYEYDIDTFTKKVFRTRNGTSWVDITGKNNGMRDTLSLHLGLLMKDIRGIEVKTEVQYEALPASKNTDHIVYLIRG